MMPDLGTYAGAVLGAYGVTLALVAGLVALSVLRAARIRQSLEAAERRRPEANDERT